MTYEYTRYALSLSGLIHILLDDYMYNLQLLSVSVQCTVRVHL